ncbi:hypothetical protein [Methanothermobacter thermautotrophicus]|jgi:hypothetical protein|uniref:Uncharacterized protein n=1 Tax=Methanothermobacter defluvii TaxID=49339 RepID=A0A371NAU0_9EURY|nr:hypothetical protein [Methanothermobacter thermautotrophicus]REE25247.1 hypothetical protein C7452_1597 [Methanothermobacter defluvii]WBF08212.1 hypothetical protein ISG36_00350 [Methanothermobacter thermautotrophicus]
MRTTVISVILLFLIVGGIFTAAAANETGNNSSAVNKTVKGGGGVQPLSLSASIEVEPSSINLGTVYPDGIERSYPNAVTATVTYFFAWQDTLSVRADGNLVNTADSSLRIPLSSLKFSTPSLSKRSFTTSDQTIMTYTGGFFLPGSRSVTMSLYITVPPYTDPGTYQTTLIYTAT